MKCNTHQEGSTYMNSIETITLTVTFADGTKQRKTLYAEDISADLEREILETIEAPALYAWASGVGV